MELGAERTQPFSGVRPAYVYGSHEHIIGGVKRIGWAGTKYNDRMVIAAISSANSVSVVPMIVDNPGRRLV
jgi:hypothetical protein